MKEQSNIEIERKFLIDKQSALKLIAENKGIKHTKIEQLYLKTDNEQTEKRIRKIDTGEGVQYKYTIKTEIKDNSLSRKEYEIDIEPEEYELIKANESQILSRINKDRYILNYNKLILEIDIYAFWTSAAILEIELTSESQEVDIPNELNIIKEVTDDKRFKNKQLSLNNNIINEV